MCACAGTQHCIALGGSSDRYGIDDASFEYCYSSEKSQDESANVLVSNTGEKFYVVNSKYIEYANQILEKQGSPGMVGMSANMTRSEIQKFIDYCQDK